MSVSGGDDVWGHALVLPNPIHGLSAPLEYAQAWDVWRYCHEGGYAWYQDNEGLRRHRNGWIESRWDLGSRKSFADVVMFVDTSDDSALTHSITYSNDGMETWSTDTYLPETLQDMPDARWIRVLTTIETAAPVFIRDIRFGPCGDLDGDGVVGLADLAELVANYGASGHVLYDNGDLDRDGDVDSNDLKRLLRVYGDTW
jgi:hypothetical protein